MQIMIDFEKVDEETVADLVEWLLDIAEECFEEGCTAEEILVSFGRVAQSVALTMTDDIIH